MYLLYFSPDHPGQLVTSLPDDDKEILYHAMINTRKKKMIEQGYNYLDGPIHSTAEFFETRIKNLEKLIPPSLFSRNRKKNKKGSKKKKSITFEDSEGEDLDEGHKGEKFCQCCSTRGHITDECTTLKALIMQAKRKKG